MYLVVVDANTCSRIGLRQILSEAGFEPSAEAESIEACQALLPTGTSSILLLACNVLPRDPFPLIEYLHQQYPYMHLVLILAECDSLPLQISVVEEHSKEYYLQGLASLGVCGAILKSDPSEQIIAAIRTIAQDQPWFSSALLQHLLETKPVSLTQEETTLLRLLVSGETERQMAVVLGKSQRTIRRRLERIYTKLGTENKFEAAYVAGLYRLLSK